MSAEVAFADTRVKLFFVRRSKRGPWNGLITTDLKLDFFKAYEMYSRRWALEVVYYDKHIIM
jgi:hypothetical protein